ncbi:hypothetical protein HK405_015149, partial [Cladochytrium tenue]
MLHTIIPDASEPSFSSEVGDNASPEANPLDCPRYSRFSISSGVYKSVDGHDLLVYLMVPNQQSSTNNEKGRKIIVKFHGGLLVTGSALYPDWFAEWLLDLAVAEDAIIVAPDYRLLPEATAAEICSDVDDFWEWFAAHSYSEGSFRQGLTGFVAKNHPGVTLDFNRVVAVGESAGGHLALLSGLLLGATPSTATTAAAASTADAGELGHPSFSGLRAVIAQYPTLDTSILGTPPGMPLLPDAVFDTHVASLPDSAVVSAALPPYRMPLAISMIQRGLLAARLPRSDSRLWLLDLLRSRISDRGNRDVGKDSEGPASGVVDVPYQLLVHGADDFLVPAGPSEEYVRIGMELWGDQKVDLTSGAIFVTGASTGIGRDAVLYLASRGYTVFAGVRSTSDGDAVVEAFAGELPADPRRPGRIVPVLADVTDEASLRAAAATVAEFCAASGEPFVALVNNAGISLPAAPIELVDDHKARHVYDVNFFGTLNTTAIFLPLLRQNKGRIIFVSSTAPMVPLAGNSIYASSKAALDTAIDCLRIEMMPFHIPVVSIQPGNTRSAIWNKSPQPVVAVAEPETSVAPATANGSDAVRPVDAYAQLLAIFPARTVKLESLAQDPRAITSPAVLHAVIAAAPRRRYVVGDAASFEFLDRPELAERAKKFEKGLALFNVLFVVALFGFTLYRMVITASVQFNGVPHLVDMSDSYNYVNEVDRTADAAPQSHASTTPTPLACLLDSQSALDSEVAHIASVFELKESEDTWLQLDEALARLNAIVRGSHHLPGVVPAVKRLKLAILVALSTERTRLARTGMALVETMAAALGDRFEPLVDITVPPLLRLCSRANKVFVSCANATLKAVVEAAGVPSIIPLLHESLQSNSKSLRASAADCLVAVLEANNPSRIEAFADAVEAAIKLTVVDAAPESQKGAHLSKERRDPVVANPPEPAANDDQRSGFGRIKLNALGETTTVPPAAFEVPQLGSAMRAPRPIQPAGIQPVAGGSNLTTPMPSALFAGPRRIFLDRPARIPSATNAASELSTAQPSHAPDHFGSAAVRILKEETAAHATVSAARPAATPMALPLRARALRVLNSAAVNPPEVPPSIQGSQLGTADESIQQASTSGAKVAALRRLNRAPPAVAAPAARTASNSQPKSGPPPPPDRPAAVAPASVPQLNLAAVANKLKSSDWSTRLRAVETVNEYIAAATGPAAPAAGLADARGRLPKLYDTYLLTLADSHAKCVAAAVAGLAALAPALGCDDATLDAVVPRLVGCCLLPPAAKVPPALARRGRDLLATLMDIKGLEPVAVAAAQALNAPEFSRALRVRLGCLGMLAEIPDEEWAVLAAGKPSSLKVIVLRLLASASEPDAAAHRLLRPILSALSDIAPEIFWGMWANAKPSERRSVNALFGSKDIFIDRKELVAARKPIHSESAMVGDAEPSTPSRKSTSPPWAHRPSSSPATPFRSAADAIPPRPSSVGGTPRAFESGLVLARTHHTATRGLSTYGTPVAPTSAVVAAWPASTSSSPATPLRPPTRLPVRPSSAGSARRHASFTLSDRPADADNDAVDHGDDPRPALDFVLLGDVLEDDAGQAVAAEDGDENDDDDAYMFNDLGMAAAAPLIAVAAERSSLADVAHSEIGPENPVAAAQTPSRTIAGSITEVVTAAVSSTSPASPAAAASPPSALHHHRADTPRPASFELPRSVHFQLPTPRCRMPRTSLPSPAPRHHLGGAVVSAAAPRATRSPPSTPLPPPLSLSRIPLAAMPPLPGAPASPASTLAARSSPCSPASLSDGGPSQRRSLGDLMTSKAPKAALSPRHTSPATADGTSMAPSLSLRLPRSAPPTPLPASAAAAAASAGPLATRSLPPSPHPTQLQPLGSPLTTAATCASPSPLLPSPADLCCNPLLQQQAAVERAMRAGIDAL